MQKERIDAVRVSAADYRKLQRLSDDQAIPLRTLIRSIIHQRLAEIELDDDGGTDDEFTP